MSSKLFIIILSFLGVENTFAYTPKEGNISVIISPFFFRTHFDETDSGASSPLLGGTALMAIGDISKKGSLELGFIHMNKIFIRGSGQTHVAEQTQVIHITMGYRRWWSPRLSTSWSVFSAYPMGDINLIHTNYTLPADQPITSAQDKVEYGLDLALQYELYAQGRFAMISDIRYSHSVTNKPQESGHHYGVMLGLRYFIQDKQTPSPPPK
jgi:hypothetical protein